MEQDFFPGFSHIFLILLLLPLDIEIRISLCFLQRWLQEMILFYCRHSELNGDLRSLILHRSVVLHANCIRRHIYPDLLPIRSPLTGDSRKLWATNRKSRRFRLAFVRFRATDWRFPVCSLSWTDDTSSTLLICTIRLPYLHII